MTPPITYLSLKLASARKAGQRSTDDVTFRILTDAQASPEPEPAQSLPRRKGRKILAHEAINHWESYDDRAACVRLISTHDFIDELVISKNNLRRN